MSSIRGLGRLMVAFGQVLILEFYVVAGAVGEERFFFFRQLAHLFDRAAYIQKAAGQTLARRYQAAGADDHIVFKYRTVHHNTAHADQHPAADLAAMKHDFVRDSHVVADQQREAFGVERPSVGDMQHAAVLHAGARANADAVHITADNRQRPHRAVGADHDIANYHRRAVNKGAFAEAWRVLQERTNGHDSFLL